MLSIFLLLITGIYFLLTLGLIIIWLKNSPYVLPKTAERTSNEIKISVIIPVRNEAENIGFLMRNLANQTLPKTQFEVIIADDDSTDETLQLVETFKKNTSLQLIINQLKPTANNTSPKKRAIHSSIQLARGELIVTTDGDCRVGSQWLETILAFQQQTGAYLISSAVSFRSETPNVLLKFTDAIQTIEFASLIGSGACAMFVRQPNMCNGANLCYRKDVFYEVDGFKGNENLASGDDEFLMHKIANLYPAKVKFLKNQAVIVATSAHQTLQSFYNQRKRWASKWKHYSKWQNSALAIFIFLVNLAMPISVVAFLSNSINIAIFCWVVFLKLSAELVFLGLLLAFLRKAKLILLIPIVQFIYPFYVIFFGIIAQFEQQYIWKNRTLR